jgi:serine/threonine protein kinase
MQKAKKTSGISKADTMRAEAGKPHSGTFIGMGDPKVDTIPNPPISRPSDLDTVKKTEKDYYEVGDLLGEGGMGKVFRVRHVVKNRKGQVVIDKDAVMKQMSFEQAAAEITDPVEFEKFKKRMYDRFITEVQLVAKLDHPNIVSITDFDETEDGDPYFIMEMLEGSDLHNIRVQAGELSWSQVRKIMLQTCDALIAAHEYEENGERKPIIHRDIKPMNIFVVPTRNGEQLVKVLDFGLAKIVDKNEDGVTKKGEHAGGTPEYMSPEQLRGVEVDQRTDIYALGVVMFELLTGQVPFEFMPEKQPSDFENSAEYAVYLNAYYATFMNMVWDHAPMPPSNLTGGIPPEGESIVLRCLEKNPSGRYQSARELKADLEYATGEISWESSNGQAPETNGYLPSVIINQDVLNAAERQRKTHLEDINQAHEAGGHPYRGTMIVKQRGPLYQEPKKSKWNKWVAIGAAATVVIAAGGIVGLSYNRYSADGAQASQSSKVEQPVVPAKADTPLTEPIVTAQPQEDAGTPDAREVVSHEIRIRSNVSGMQVLIGDDLMCTTTGERECTMQLEEGDEPVALTFRRRGFQDENQTITPDSAKTVFIRLRPVQRNPRPVKTGTPMITSEE